MADEKRDIVIALRFDTKDAEGNARSVETNLKDIEESLKKIGSSKDTKLLAKEMQELNAVVKNQNLTWGEAGKTIEQYQNIALAAGSTSPIGQEAIRRAGELKQEVDVLTRSIDNAAQRGQALQGALAIGTTVTAGYGALQGVMALAGQENEALMQSLVKMQAAQSVLTGIEQIRLAVEKEGVLMMTLKNTQTKIATALTAAYATVVGTATGAMKIFRLALIATGIGAIVVALGLLIANFDKVSEAVIKGSKWVQGLAKEFREMGAGMQTLIGILSFGLVPAISYAIKLFEDMGGVDDEQTRKHKANIDSKIKDIERQRDSYVQAKKDELAAAQERFNEEDDALNHQMALIQANGQSTIEIERQILENKKQSAEEQIALTQEILEAEYRANLEILRLKAQTNSIVAGALSQINADIKKAGGEDAYINALIGSDKDLTELKDTLVKTEQEIEIFEVKVAKIRRDAAEKEKDWRDGINEEIIQAESRKAEAIKTINSELAAFNIEEYNKELQAKKDAQKKADEEELQRKLNLSDNVNGAAQNTLDFASNLNAAFGKENEKAAKRDFQINKAKNLVEAGNDGVKAVLSTFANTPTGIIGKSIAATGAGVFAAANIARIARSKYSGGGGGGSSSVSIPRVSSGGANGGATGQAQQNDNLTNIASLLNNTPSPVLVVDSFNKVNNEASKIKTVSSI